MQKEISLNNFQVISRLGQGSFAQVYKVKRKSDNTVYALKKINTTSMKQKDKINALNQIRILASITGENIIQYKNSFYDESSNDLCIVLQYAGQGDILQKIKQYKKLDKVIEEQQIWKAMVHISKGLRILHKENVLHRDLKSANIFITDQGFYKLADLNISKILKTSFAQTQTGTPYYCSPEVWKQYPYNSKSDMWSLGCVLYQMASGKPPFIASDIQTLYKKICIGIFSRIPNIYSDQLSNKINSLLHLNPYVRPSADEILKCPIVNKHYQGNHFEELTPNILMQTIKLNEQGWKNINNNLPKPKYSKQKQNLRPQQIQTFSNQNKTIVFRPHHRLYKLSRPVSSKSDKKQNEDTSNRNPNQNIMKNVSEVYTKNNIQCNVEKQNQNTNQYGKGPIVSKFTIAPQKIKANRKIILPPINPTSRPRKNSQNTQSSKAPLITHRIFSRNSSKSKVLQSNNLISQQQTQRDYKQIRIA